MNAFPLQKIDLYTEDEFFAWCEQNPDEKYELVNGEIIAMAGASRNHIQICKNFTRAFDNHLEATKCSAYSSDFYVKAADEKLYLPDVVVDCTDQASGDDKMAIAPTIIVEVVSKSTRETDFSQKLRDYQKIPSLQEYAIVEQDSQHVYVFRKSQNWQGQSYNSGAIYFESIDCTVTLDEIYQRVIFQAA